MKKKLWLVIFILIIVFISIGTYIYTFEDKEISYKGTLV